MKKKLNPAKIARIQERRGSGATFEDLAREFGVSIGTVSNALKARAPSVRPPKKRSDGATETAEAPASDELPSIDDLRKSLASQVRSLRSDADNAETPAQRATANRLLVAATQLLARVTPPDPNVAPPGMMMVEVGEMKKFAKQGEARFQALLNNMFDEMDSLPGCPRCGARQVAPKD